MTFFKWQLKPLHLSSGLFSRWVMCSELSSHLSPTCYGMDGYWGCSPPPPAINYYVFKVLRVRRDCTCRTKAAVFMTVGMGGTRCDGFQRRVEMFLVFIGVGIKPTTGNKGE